MIKYDLKFGCGVYVYRGLIAPNKSVKDIRDEIEDDEESKGNKVSKPLPGADASNLAEEEKKANTAGKGYQFQLINDEESGTGYTQSQFNASSNNVAVAPQVVAATKSDKMYSTHGRMAAGGQAPLAGQPSQGPAGSSYSNSGFD